MSVATATSAWCSWALTITGSRSTSSPEAPGYWSREPEELVLGKAPRPGTDGQLEPEGFGAGLEDGDRLREDVFVDEEPAAPVLAARRSNSIASAAPLDSSRREALAIGSAVRSAIAVWKFNSASRRPWLISGWYGVYAVYQAGFSTRFRRRTAGVMVP